MAKSTAFLAIFALGIGTASSLMGDATLYTVLPTHPADAGIALASVGVILSINRVIRLVTNGPAGWLYDRVLDRRIIFLASLVIGAVSTALYAISSSFEPFFFARLLWGAAWSGIWVGGNAIVLEMAPENARGRWVGIYQVWFFFGSAVGSFLGGVLTDAFGYHNALWIGAAISTLGAFIAAVGLLNHFHLRSPRFSEGRDRDRTHEKSMIAQLQSSDKGVLTGDFVNSISQPSLRITRPRFVFDLRAISPQLWAVIASHGINRLVVAGVVTSTLGLLIRDLRGDAFGVASITGALLATRTLVSLGSAGIFGEWSDRRSSRWGLLLSGLVMGAAGILLFAISDWFAFLAGALVGAVASGSIQSIATSLVGDLSPIAERGRILGIFNTAGDLGSAIGPLAAFALLPITGLGVVFITCAALMAGNATWVIVLKKT